MEQGLSEEQVNRLFSEQQAERLKHEVLQRALRERPEIVEKNLGQIKTFIDEGLNMIQTFEEATHKKHPKIYADTDVVYVLSGPGPYSYKMLERGKTDLDDTVYHKWAWSRNMDRARVRAGYALVGMVAAKRIENQTGAEKSPKDLTTNDYEEFGPYLMYASTTWQNSHIRHVHKLLSKSGHFKIPDSKLIMYDVFINRQGEKIPMVHTEDQIESLQFPTRPDGNPPRRVAIVAHPAHLMRAMHILGKYPDSIPAGTILQPFPIPTPVAAVTEFAGNELIGTIVTTFIRQRASLTPYTKYQL